MKLSLTRLDDKPVIPGSVAQIACEVSAVHVEGDHTLFIGKVTDIHLEDVEPLVFYSGRYRSLVEEKPAVTIISLKKETVWKRFIINRDNLRHTGKEKAKSTVMALGFFDGLHQGHCKVIKRLAAEMAKENNVSLAVMSFFPHPKSVISNRKSKFTI